MEETKTFFLNGVGGETKYWRFIADCMKQTNPQVLEYPSYGNYSELINDYLYLDNYYLHLKELLDSYEIETPVNLVGYSMGGMVALDFAAKFPTKINKLVLVSTPIKDSSLKIPFHYRKFCTFVYNSPRAQRVIKSGSAKLADFLGRFGIHNHNLRFAALTDPKKMFRFYLDLFSCDNSSRVNEIDCKTLVVYGKTDRYLSNTTVISLYEKIRRARIVTFSCGHYMLRDMPIPLSAEIETFLLE